MAVSLLVITHENIGNALVNTATTMLGVRPMHIDVLGVTRDTSPEDILEHAKQLVADNSETLVMTDMYGSTPSNIACKLCTDNKVRVVGGVNLPMLVRVLNYPRLELDELVNKAISGGKDGVLTCNMEHD